MADQSHIEWTDATWNPVAGCSVVSPGCTNCYAMRRVAPRLSANPATPHYAGTVKSSKGGPVWTGKIGVAADAVFMKPLTWRRPRMIFVNSTSDLFHEGVPDEVIDLIFAVMALCPQHVFQLLSKRSARMRAYCSSPSAIERISALVYRERYEQGANHPDSGRLWRTRDRRQRQNLATEEASRETKAQGGYELSEGRRAYGLSARESRIPEPRRIPSDHDDYRRHEDGDGCTPGGLDAFQRSHSFGIDDQSQERREVRQRIGESGVGDAVGTAASCAGGAERQQASTKRQQTPENETNGSGRSSDARLAGIRSHGEGHRRNVRDESESCFRDLHQEDLATHLTWPLPNLWLGVSVEDQARANERIPDLLATPAAIRFISAEPLLGPVNLRRIRIAPDHHTIIDALDGYAIADSISGSGQKRTMLDWVIAGGESGHVARPMHPAWARSLRDQCAAAGTPFFFKQWGEWAPVCGLNDEQIDRCYKPAPAAHPGATRKCLVDQCVLHADGSRHGIAEPMAFLQGTRAMMMMQVGKRAAGRELDGVIHDARPDVQP